MIMNIYINKFDYQNLIDLFIPWSHCPLGDVAVIMKYNFQTSYTE